ncbi:transposase, partial [Novosphingobium sp. AP12]
DCPHVRGSSDHGMGRSRGGLTTKLHALVDADGRPVGLRLTGGQVHDACEAEALIEAIPEGATLLGDKGYDSTAIREAAAARNIWANIPNRSNRKQRFGFSSWLYRQRNLVERFFNRIKQFRGIATRYDKDAANYLAAIKLICARLWCNAQLVYTLKWPPAVPGRFTPPLPVTRILYSLDR